MRKKARNAISRMNMQKSEKETREKETYERIKAHEIPKQSKREC